jgi:hypothetical protein
MSVELQTYIMLIICIAFFAATITTVIQLFRRKFHNTKTPALIALFAFISFFSFQEYLEISYQKNLYGISFDVGKNTINFSCCYDHHGDGLDVDLFEGNPTDYKELNLIGMASLPRSILNNNNYKYEQKWTSVTSKTEISSRTISLARQAVQFIDKPQRDQAITMFDSLMLHDASLYAFIYNDRNSIDFWLINPELGKFFAIHHYN